MPAMTWFSSAWSTRSPEKSGYLVVLPMMARPAAASARVMLVPPPPKSHSNTTPSAGSPGAARSPASAALESGTSVAGTPPGDRPGFARNALRSAPTTPGPQCAGTAMVTGSPPPAARAIASSASARTTSPRCEDPSEATSGTGSPTRSTNPVKPSPGWLGPGSTPTSGARSLNTVSTDRRVSGGAPTRAATKLVVPTDNPSASLINEYIPAGSEEISTHHSCRTPVAGPIPLWLRNP